MHWRDDPGEPGLDRRAGELAEDDAPDTEAVYTLFAH
jgi:hypothetical protein